MMPCVGSQSAGCVAPQEMPSAEDGGRSEAGTPTPNSKASGAAPAAAAPEPETDQWVQCDRCRTWRVVPAQHWPSVEADTSEVSAGRITLWQGMSLQLTPGSWQSFFLLRALSQFSFAPHYCQAWEEYFWDMSKSTVMPNRVSTRTAVPMRRW